MTNPKSPPQPAVSVEQALLEAHAVFSRYTELHLAKKTEDGNAKANANAEMAYKMAAALKAHRLAAAPKPPQGGDRHAGNLAAFEAGEIAAKNGPTDELDRVVRLALENDAAHRLTAAPKVGLPSDAGVCAYDRQECTVTLALNNEEEVVALVRALPSKNRVWLAPDMDEGTALALRPADGREMDHA